MSERYDTEQTVHDRAPFSRLKVIAWEGERENFRGSAILEMQDAGIVNVLHVEVEEAHREKGVATRMLEFALTQFRDEVREVRSHLATGTADVLFASMRAAHPSIRFVEM